MGTLPHGLILIEIQIKMVNGTERMGRDGMVVQAYVGTQRTEKIETLLLVHFTEKSSLLAKSVEKGKDRSELVLSMKI